MKVIVGLGNPGKKFEKTRHNLGFMVLDGFSRKNKFPKFEMRKEFLAEISEKKIGKEKIILAKPQTFMNNSGKSVKILTRTFNLDLKNLFVIHDDLDISFGKIKISFGRGSGGHKGVQSIIDELKTKNFFRFRIGIKPKQNYITLYSSIENFVLGKFDENERKILKEIIEKACRAIEVAIKESVEKAMSEFNK
jgi:PTH1 family peptidyl-tRNA hydrolase